MIFEIFAYALAGGVASLAVCLYFWKRGQFEDSEDVKYELFREDQESE